MQHHCRLSRVDAHKLLTEGRFLLRYGTVAEAAVTGCLSGSQIRSIRSAVTSVLADLFDEHQQTVVDAVTGLDPVATSQVCQTWRQRGEAIIDRPEPSVADRIFKWSKLEDGTVVGQFVFDPTSGAIILAALANARTDDRGDERTHAQTHADAVATMAAFFNANHDGDGTPRHLPHVGLELHLTQRSAAEVHDLLYPDCDRRDCSNHDTCEPDALFDAVFGATGSSPPTPPSSTTAPASVRHRAICSVPSPNATAAAASTDVTAKWPGATHTTSSTGSKTV